jgi:hypothetical protein
MQTRSSGEQLKTYLGVMNEATITQSVLYLWNAIEYHDPKVKNRRRSDDSSPFYDFNVPSVYQFLLEVNWALP